MPNIKVPEGQFVPSHNKPFLREINLPGHLHNTNPAKVVGQAQAVPVKIETLLNQDYQLRQAFDLLKGVAVFRHIGG